MANPLTIAGFPDVLDSRFREITDGQYDQVEDMIGRLYSVQTPTQYTEKGSALTGMGLFSEFTGNVAYDGPDQGYDWSSTPKQYAKGITVERMLVEYDQFNIIETRFKLLARSAYDTRQIEAALTFTNAFSTDAGYTHSEGVALCSNSHTSPRAGVSTATGFDNLTTTAFSPAGVKAAFIQMRKFKADNGQPIGNHGAGMILGPVDLQDRAEEIFGTMKGLDSAEGTKNVLEGRYRYVPWIRLTDTNDHFFINESMMKECLFWFDKVKPEFARVEEFDTLIAKYRGYYVSHRARSDWRWVLGAQVS